MKELKIFFARVDAFRNDSVLRMPRLYHRSTEGDYLVCAKTAKEAKSMLQRAISFGSVNIPKEEEQERWLTAIGKKPAMQYRSICKINKMRTYPNGTDKPYVMKFHFDFSIQPATAPKTIKSQKR